MMAGGLGLRLRLAAGTALALVALAAPTPTLAATGEDVRVRYGRHADHIRLVFDWQERTNYEVMLSEDGVHIVFDAENGFDLSRIRRHPDVQATEDPEGGLHIRYDRAKSAKHFRHGDSVVLDLLETSAGEPLVDEAAIAAAEEAKQAREAPRFPPMPPRRPDPNAAATSGEDPTAEASSPKSQPTAAKPSAAVAGKAGEAGEGPPNLAEIAPPDLQDALPKTAAPVDKAKTVVTATTENGRIILGIEAPDVRAAAYTRAGGHWIILDKPMSLDLSAMDALNLDPVALPAVDMTVIQMNVGAAPSLTAWRDGDIWRFGLQAEPAAPVGQPVTVERRRGKPQGPRIEVIKAEGARLLRVIDPEVGDALFVAVVDSARHVAERIEAPDAAMPQTALGIVVQPRMEGVGVALNNGTMVVRRRGGLNLSDPEKQMMAAGGLRPSALQLEEWRGDDSSYMIGLENRLSQLNGVNDLSRNLFRLELARYSLANGYAAESIGYLSAIEHTDQGADEDPQFRLMRGIARAMLGQYDLASIDLELAQFSGDPHAEIWRAMAMVRRGEYRLAAAKFRRNWAAVGDWPSIQRARFTLAAGEAAMIAGLPEVAESFLERAQLRDRITEKEQAAFAIVAAGVQALRGDPDGAARRYAEAYDMGGREIKAIAELALVRLEYASGEVDADTASERLRRLQRHWRGDRTEYEILKTLGEIRLETSGFREGFWALGEAARRFSDRYDTSDVRSILSTGFKHAFIDGGADEMDPLQAVALFQDYQDLAPPGAQGDRVLAGFAKRLASLDLVDEADEIYEHLVRRRLNGEPRVEAVVALAELRASRRQWAGVLEALDQAGGDVPDAKSALRLLHLRAEALVGADRPNEGLSLLTDAPDDESQLFRAKIAWRAGDWVSVRMAYRTLAQNGAFDGETLDADQASAVVRWAVAATMLRNVDEAGDLNARYGARIEDARLKSALAALATPNAAGENALATARAALDNTAGLARAIDGYNEAG